MHKGKIGGLFTQRRCIGLVVQITATHIRLNKDKIQSYEKVHD